ncbi:phiSA1p31-related protein [Streptomyces cinerochromogenes]|uniref:PhiSA1p31-related protein n=1 Tax=Streptomyces cinerochromogenes TaxID=66422 RepID=A0ABW7BEI7_9ACTN
MTERFEVGQKVKIFSNKHGEIVCGPVRSTFGGYTGYVVRVDGDDVWHRAADLASVPEPPQFSVDDKVTHRTFGPGEIAFGPFEHYAGQSQYLMKQEDGRHILAAPEALTAAEPEPIKVGDRVRVVRAFAAEHRHGETGVVTSTTEEWRSWPGDVHQYSVTMDSTGGELYVAELERVDEPADTYEYEGVIYDLSVKYRDRDGDVWRFERRPDGKVRGVWTNRDVTDYDCLLDEVANDCGPLTRVND